MIKARSDLLLSLSIDRSRTAYQREVNLWCVCKLVGRQPQSGTARMACEAVFSMEHLQVFGSHTEAAGVTGYQENMRRVGNLPMLMRQSFYLMSRSLEIDMELRETAEECR